MGEKGSIKNLYKSWHLFLEEKKKKKQKQQLKKTSKFKVFFITFFTLILSPFFFNNKKTKQELKKSLKQIDILIIEIEKEKNIEVLIELKDELHSYKTKIKENDDKLLRQTIKKIEKAEKVIDAKIEELNLIENSEEKRKIVPNIDEKQDNVKELIKSTKIKEEKSLDNLEKEKIELKSNINIEKDPDIIEFLNYMKLEINTIEYKLNGDTNLFQLKYLKTRIIELNYKRDNFKDNYDFSKIKEIYKSKDKYKLLENNETLENLYQKCDDKIKKISEIKNDKKEEKIKIEKQDNFNLEEIKKVNIFLNREIKKQQLQISKLKLVLAKTEKKLKKSTLLSYIKNMIKNSIKICFDIIPITCFKNKLVGGLTSAFMLNNSIRGIRNLVNDDQIEYARLLNNINNQKDCIFNTRLVYEDTITQIEFLKYDLLSKYSFSDLKNVFNKIYEIEEEIKIKNKMLSDLEIELENTYDKTRGKAKRYTA